MQSFVCNICIDTTVYISSMVVPFHTNLLQFHLICSLSNTSLQIFIQNKQLYDDFIITAENLVFFFFLSRNCIEYINI